jgi:hypothetical protein
VVGYTDREMLAFHFQAMIQSHLETVQAISKFSLPGDACGLKCTPANLHFGLIPHYILCWPFLTKEK